MLKYIRREIKMKTLTPESFELLEERMILNATFLDADQELDRVSLESQKFRIALEEETQLRSRLQDEKKKLVTELSKSKHEMEKEIIELKRQLQDTKKVRMESDRLLLQSQAKQGELIDELTTLRSRSSGEDGKSSPIKVSPQRRYYFYIYTF
jgi:ClpP class serine protease